MTDPRILSTARTLPFSAAAIYQAFAAPELLAAWWGPDGFSNTFEIFEFVVGGRWKFVMHGPDGKHYDNESLFVELVPNSKVVIEHVCAPHFVLSVTLAPDSNGTQLRWEQAFDDEATAQAVQAIVGPANEQNIDRLHQTLSQVSGRTA